MNTIAHLSNARPSPHSERSRRVKRIIENLPAEETLDAFAPYAARVPADAVSAMSSEANVLLGIALDLLEEHLDGASAGSWGSKVSELVFLAKQRVKVANLVQERLVSQLVGELSGRSPDSPDSTVRLAMGETCDGEDNSGVAQLAEFDAAAEE